MRIRALLLGLILLLTPQARGQDFFRERVGPLLEQRCLSCHDATRKRGGLDLSTASTARTGGDNGPVILSGQPAKSRLLDMVSGPAPRMPRAGPKLTANEVALLRRWIETGAAWPEGVKLTPRKLEPEETWWSLRPLTRPALPAVRETAWPRTPVDAFILATLEKRGLRPAPEADRRTLLRRVYFDLVGLPPSPEAFEAFVRDSSHRAYEHVVDQLLASPRYGERWGRHWLDVVHYGDTHGYDKDKRRDHAWPYRDWVIRALNTDLDYRSFVLQQLAGDVQAPGDPEGIIAAGFVVAGPWDFVGQVELREGTLDKEKTRALDRDDMVTNAIGSFVSLTIGCARCHDHKFDPIPSRDYYRLQAVFSGVERGPRPLSGTIPVARRKKLEERTQFLAARKKVEKAIADATGPRVAQLDARIAAVKTALAALPLPAAAPSPSNGWHSGIEAKPEVMKWVQVDLGAAVPLEEIRLVPARPTDFRDSPGFGFPARFRVEISDEPRFSKPVVIADHTREDFPNPGDDPVVARVGKTGRFVRVTATRLWERQADYVFALAELQVISAGKNLALGRPVTSLDSIEAGRWSRGYLVDHHDSRRRLPALDDPATPERIRQRSSQVALLRNLQQERTTEARRLTPPALAADLEKLNTSLSRLESELSKPIAGPMAYSVMPIPPRPIWVLRRGDVEQKKEVAQPGGLSCVVGVEPDFGVQGTSEGVRRLALARWIADSANPLTWRSAVNRVWHYHFGRGIVDTPNDFGKMGGLPSHPELLDWLACEFRDRGGSLKWLHRQIVTSAVYRQSTRHDEAAARVDSDNRFLWRMNRRRLDAESIRDAVLAVSGQLKDTMGGPGFALFRFKDDHSPVYDHSDLASIHDPRTYRRTVYRFTVRSVPNPFLDSLDCADPNQATPVRNTTLTALQSLALLNNPFMVRQATHFADRIRRTTSSEAEQVELAYRLAFGRAPSPEEGELVRAHLGKHGLEAMCRVLLNANEFVFVD